MLPSTRLPADLNIRVSTPRFAMGTARRLGLAAWGAATEVRDVRALHGALTELGKEHPTGIGALLFTRDAHPVSTDVRSAVSEMVRDTPALRGLVVVHSSEGFGAAMLRAVVAGLSLMSRSTPQRFVSSLPAGAAMLINMLPNDPRTVPRDIVHAMELLCLALAPAPSEGR